MKKIRKMVSKLWCILLCTLIVACSDSSDVPSPEPEPTPTEKDYELADNVIELEGDLLEHIISVEGNTLVYDSRTPNKEIPEVGEIILVSQVTDVFPYGFLGKVTKVSKEGDILVITEAVALDEVFTYLDVSASYELTPDNATAISRSADPEFKKFIIPLEKEISDGINWDGQLVLGIKVDAFFKVDKRNGKNIRNGKITVSSLQQMNMTLNIVSEKEYEKSVNIPPKAILLPPMQFGPILLVPALQPYLFIQAEGSIEMHPSMNCLQIRTVSLAFDGNSWSFNNDSTNEPTIDFNLTPDIEMEGIIFSGIGVAMEFRIGGNEDNKAYIDAKLGSQISGEVTLATNPNSLYESGKDSKLDFNMQLTAGGGAGIKFFFIEKEWQKYPLNLSFLESSYHFFPSFEQGTYKFEEGSIVASTQLARNLLWKQNVGLALYKGSECIESYSPVEYKFENDFKGQNPLRATFEGISKEELSDYSIWSYVKWGDLFIRCANLPMGGIEAVDLGLSVKWANCNLGASLPEDYGNYFAFGEVKPKTEYEEENWNNPRTTKLWGDNDAAYATWGKTWRMPTKADCEELLRECTWNLVDRGNIKGYEVVGKNGNSIFLPLTGSYSSVEGKNYEARYRTSEADIDEGGYDDPSTIVMELQKDFTDTELDHAAGWGGHPIRPVEISLVGKWIREDCDCEPSCHYLFNENGSGYYSETADGQVYKSEFTWDFDGKFLELIRKETDSVEDDGVDKFKIDFQSGSRFARYSSDYDFEAIEINTVYFNKAQ